MDWYKVSRTVIEVNPTVIPLTHNSPVFLTSASHVLSVRVSEPLAGVVNERPAIVSFDSRYTILEFEGNDFTAKARLARHHAIARFKR